MLKVSSESVSNSSRASLQSAGSRNDNLSYSNYKTKQDYSSSISCLSRNSSRSVCINKDLVDEQINFENQSVKVKRKSKKQPKKSFISIHKKLSSENNLL